MEITVLVENSPPEPPRNLTAEFGLSLHVKHRGRSILFDLGTTGAFADNARRLGIDLAFVDAAVLSHHHFDHGGGLKRFLRCNETAPVYLRDCDDHDQTFRAFGVLKRPIGIDRDLIDAHGDRFVAVDGLTEILPDVFLMTDLAGSHALPPGNRHLWVRRGDRMIRDPFDHELQMVIRDPDGIVVFSGCSHSGILNMVDAAIRQFPGKAVKTVIGGFHLIDNPLLKTMAGTPDEVAGVGLDLAERNIQTVLSGHCTGQRAFSVLKTVLGDTLEPIHTGSRFTI